MSIFEVIMLLCFGAAWPFSIARSLKSKTTNGKSLFFLVILMVGYVSGIINKVVYNYDFVLYLYILNLAMVAFDTMLWVRNKSFENKQMKNEQN